MKIHHSKFTSFLHTFFSHAFPVSQEKPLSAASLAFSFAARWIPDCAAPPVQKESLGRDWRRLVSSAANAAVRSPLSGCSVFAAGAFTGAGTGAGAAFALPLAFAFAFGAFAGSSGLLPGGVPWRPQACSVAACDKVWP